jgi:hypothetical protein
MVSQPRQSPGLGFWLYRLALPPTLPNEAPFFFIEVDKAAHRHITAPFLKIFGRIFTSNNATKPQFGSSSCLLDGNGTKMPDGQSSLGCRSSTAIRSILNDEAFHTCGSDAQTEA